MCAFILFWLCNLENCWSYISLKLPLALKSEDCLQSMALEHLILLFKKRVRGVVICWFCFAFFPWYVNANCLTDFYPLGSIEWVVFTYSVQFRKNLCRMGIIPKCWMAVSCPVSLGECSCLRQMLNIKPLLLNIKYLCTSNLPGFCPPERARFCGLDRQLAALKLYSYLYLV